MTPRDAASSSNVDEADLPPSLPTPLPIRVSRLTSRPLDPKIPAARSSCPRRQAVRPQEVAHAGAAFWDCCSPFRLDLEVRTDQPRPRLASQPRRVAAGFTCVKGGPSISFEIRKISVASPEWRGKFIPLLQPIARQERGRSLGRSIPTAFAGCSLFSRPTPGPTCSSAPNTIPCIGEPVRMSSETGHRYVASLKRVADGPPSQATRLAFEPQTRPGP